MSSPLSISPAKKKINPATPTVLRIAKTEANWVDKKEVQKGFPDCSSGQRAMAEVLRKTLPPKDQDMFATTIASLEKGTADMTEFGFFVAWGVMYVSLRPQEIGV